MPASTEPAPTPSPGAHPSGAQPSSSAQPSPGPQPSPGARSTGRRPGPGRDWRTWPAALKTSAAFGCVGLVLLLAGIVSGATPVLVAATTSGSLSLISALVWRAQLIEAWRSEKGRPTRQW
jgi:hypothetical protein